MTWFPWGIYTAVGLLGGGCSVAQLCPTLCNPKVHSGPQNAGLPCPSPYPRVCSKLMSIELVMPSNHLILCCPLLLLPSIFCGIKFFSNESAFHIMWPKYQSFIFSISPSNEYSGLISFRINWFDPLAVQGTLKSLFYHHSSKASILWCSAFLKKLSSSHIHIWLLAKP